ncbi:MAG: molybdopterin synthase catalytic subunit MoaE [Gammaproteobacteria bacterium]|nr:MAG: molybdopterin synthase catalytic subunit MoaE [Gammaproteobacteria bacterium]RTZ75419.1 MAG: molybdopterin synthase catalytic subunit MoaE [Gammaproteobacteria bacterium]RTZ77847.1 MAG: molybdopterin synthase catalytic subunit MoaE [Gammaproteobacteria bacterium]
MSLVRRYVSVQEAPFDAAAEEQAVRAGNPRAGAVVTFLGLMRDINDGDRVSAMTLEHYPGMTEKALGKIIDEAESRWQLEGVRVIHRVGELRPEDPIVLVSVASRHRGDAFRACEFIIDWLKTRAPFWKKERTEEGERWVEARASDREAEQRWNAS